MNQKKIFQFKKRKERERNQINKLDHSLSLDQNSKEIVKQSILVLPYLSRKFQELILTKFDMVSNSILANMQNTSIWHIPSHFQKYIETISKTQNQGYGELLHVISFPYMP